MGHFLAYREASEQSTCVLHSASRTGGRALWIARAFLFLLSALVLACTGKARASDTQGRRPSVVLVTFNGLRADMVEGLGGRKGLTPHLDDLLAQSDWGGRAIAPSSSTLASGVSLFTGLQPWRHGVVHEGAGPIPEHLVTLTDALVELGYNVSAFRSNYWLDRPLGFGRRVGAWWPLRDGRGAAESLRRMECANQAYWIDLDLPTAPYRLYPNYLDRLEALGPEVTTRGLPRRVTGFELLSYVDPEHRLPPFVRRQLFSLYALAVARGDDILGRMANAVKEAGCWDQVVFAVVSVRGEEFGEYQQIVGGGSLGRHLIEVPMAIRLPRTAASSQPGSPSQVTPARRLLAARNGAVGTVRLFATLVEAVGGTPPPAAAPSLFRESDEGVLSELYVLDGFNQISWVRGDHQLLWSHRFGSSTPGFYGSRVQLGIRDGDGTPLAAVLREFSGSAPLGTLDGAELELLGWRDQRGGRSGAVAEDSSSPEAESLARELLEHWVHANGRNAPLEPRGGPGR